MQTQVTAHSQHDIQNKTFWQHYLRFFCLVAILFSLGTSTTLAQDDPKPVKKIRTILPSEWGIPHPAGLSFSGDFNQFFLLDKKGSSPSTGGETTVVTITPMEDLVDSINLEFVIDRAINTGYDDIGERLFLLNQEQNQLAQVNVGLDGLLDPNTLIHFDVTRFGLENAQGMDVDAARERLFIVDSATAKVIVIAIDAEFGINTAPISMIDLAYLNADELRGIAAHPASHTLFLLSPAEQLLYEVTFSGQLVARYSLTSLELVDPRGLAFAPSGDLTDPLDKIHLYIADSNLPDEITMGSNIGSQFEEQIYLPLISQLSSEILPADITESAQTQPLFGQLIEVDINPSSGSNPGPTKQTIRVQIAGSRDDAEEHITGEPLVRLTSTDLELTEEEGAQQMIGIRFVGLNIPADASILNAHIELFADEVGSMPTTLFFHGEDVDNAARYSSNLDTISSRIMTTASTTWANISPWDSIGQQHTTPDVAAIVQEIVDRNGWQSGNALAFIISGTGKRTAISYDGDPTRAPVLQVEYIIASGE